MTAAPIRKDVQVPIRPKAAFELFTKDIASWWPTDSHSLSAARGERPANVRVEPFEGGHIIETTPAGDEAHWGTITHWRPGEALGISWYVGRTEEEATDILVVFQPTDTGTRVELTHSGFERLVETATTARESYRTGWDLVLCQCFAARCAKPVMA